jgi:DNA-binding NtrC family response regulator
VSGTVLIVDDERTLARAVKAFLLESGYEAEIAADAEQAFGLIESLRPDVVFSDVRLPGMSGIELLRRIREFDSSIPVIIMTAYGTIEGAVEAVKLGAFDYLKKPVDLEELKLLADRAREHSQLRQELSYYRRQAARDVPFAGVVGDSPAMRAVLEQARHQALHRGQLHRPAGHPDGGGAVRPRARGLHRRQGVPDGSLRGGGGRLPLPR